MFDGFLKYQAEMGEAFRRLHQSYDFEIIDANRPAHLVTGDLRKNQHAICGVRFPHATL